MYSTQLKASLSLCLDSVVYMTGLSGKSYMLLPADCDRQAKHILVIPHDYIQPVTLPTGGWGGGVAVAEGCMWCVCCCVCVRVCVCVCSVGVWLCGVVCVVVCVCSPPGREETC